MTTPIEALAAALNGEDLVPLGHDLTPLAERIASRLSSSGWSLVRTEGLTELRELSEAATPGTWKLREYLHGAGRLSDAETDRILIADLYAVGDNSPANRDFIVAAIQFARAALGKVEP
jgi:hypothetical protein